MYQTGFEYPGESYEFPNEAGPWESGEGFESEESETESLEAELAQQLLETTTEADLEEFLGDLAKTVVKGASTFVKSPVGKALGGVLKNVAKTALPAVGGALGSLVLPGVGTAIGSKLGSLAGGLLEAGEAESLGEEEAQYEAAQRYVRFARAAYSNAARAPRNVPSRSVVRAASISAARQHAPSLLRNDQQMSPWRRRRRPSHQWQPSPPWGYSPPPPWDPSDPGDPYSGAGFGDWAPWSADEDEAGEAAAPAAVPGAGARAMEGRWVRRGQRIVILGT